MASAYLMSPGASEGFRRLALTHAASAGADTLIAVALAGSIFFNVSAGAARPKVLLYLGITMIPFAVLAPVMGPALDRTRSGRRQVMAGCLAGQAILCLLMASHIDSLLFYPEAFGSLALSKGYAVAKSSLVPAVVPDETVLVEANSRLALLGVTAGVVLAPLGALISTVVGANWVLRAAFLADAVAVYLALQIPRAEELASKETPMEQAELRAASIRLASTGMAVLRGAVGFLTFCLAFDLKRSGEPSWLFGLLLAAGAFGGLIGALLAPRLRRLVREETILNTALMVPALVALAGAKSYGRPGLAAVAAAVSMGTSSGRLAFDSLVQRDAPEAARGRNFARFETFFQLSWVAGAFVPVVIPLSGTVGFVILGLGLGAAAVSYFVFVRAAGRSQGAP